MLDYAYALETLVPDFQTQVVANPPRDLRSVNTSSRDAVVAQPLFRG